MGYINQLLCLMGNGAACAQEVIEYQQRQREIDAGTAIPAERIVRVEYPPAGQGCAAGYHEVGGHCEKDVTQEYVEKPIPSVIIVPRTTTPVQDSETPYGPGCAPGWLYNAETGRCVKSSFSEPMPKPTVTPDGQIVYGKSKPWYQDTEKVVLILAAGLVGAALFTFMGRK